MNEQPGRALSCSARMAKLDRTVAFQSALRMDP